MLQPWPGCRWAPGSSPSNPGWTRCTSPRWLRQWRPSPRRCAPSRTCPAWTQRKGRRTKGPDREKDDFAQQLCELGRSGVIFIFTYIYNYLYVIIIKLLSWCDIMWFMRSQPPAVRWITRWLICPYKGDPSCSGCFLSSSIEPSKTILAIHGIQEITNFGPTNHIWNRQADIVYKWI